MAWCDMCGEDYTERELHLGICRLCWKEVGLWGEEMLASIMKQLRIRERAFGLFLLAKFFNDEPDGTENVISYYLNKALTGIEEYTNCSPKDSMYAMREWVEKA